MDKYGHLIADTIAYDGHDGFWEYFFLDTYQIPYGFPEPNGVLLLPLPENEHITSVIYNLSGDHPDDFWAPVQLLEAQIMQADSGTFELLYKDKPIGQRREYFTGSISATRHANGRDWWIVLFGEDNAEYYTHLLSPAGLEFRFAGTLDTIVREGLGQTVFSPLGNYIARLDALTFAESQYITLFSFDRCTGFLQRRQTLSIPPGIYTGLAFSPNEQFLYADNNTELYQWDVFSDDIPSSQILIDTFDGFVQSGWGTIRFGPMVNGPDGRIYIVPSAGSSKYLHVIDRPDLKGTASAFRQHHINLEIWNARTAPNIPNYRLGPADGSPCDTLGLNNHPVARWRHEENIPGLPTEILFTDLSYFDPREWHWDFGDGHTSDAMSPVHTFDPGLYYVCLTVSNDYASDSTCRWIDVMTTDIRDEWNVPAHDLSVRPNPFHSDLVIHSRQGHFREAAVTLYDMHGRIVFSQLALPVPITLRIPTLASGMYYCTIIDADGMIYNQKVMKL